MVASIISISDMSKFSIILSCGWLGSEVSGCNTCHPQGREEGIQHPDLKGDVALANVFGKLFKRSQKMFLYNCFNMYCDAETQAEENCSRCLWCPFSGSACGSWR